MSLQFNPSSYLQALEMKRRAEQQNMPDLNQSVTQPIFQGLDAMNQFQQQKRQQSMQDFQMKLQGAEARDKYGPNWDGSNPSPVQSSPQDNSQPTDSMPQPTMFRGGVQSPNKLSLNQQWPQMASAGVSDTPEAQQPGRSKFVDQFNQFASSIGHPPIPHPGEVNGGQPSQPDQNQSLLDIVGHPAKTTYEQNQQNRAMESYKNRKTIQDQMEGADQNSKKSQLAQQLGKSMGIDMSGMAYDDIVKSMPLIEKKYGVDQATAYKNALLDYKETHAGDASDKQDKARWDKIIEQTNPNKATSRSALGIATLGNQKGNRALAVLNKSDATNQDINTAIADISSIFQGGAPTEAGIHAQEYDTLAGKIAGYKTYLTSEPAAVATPEIKQHLIGLVNELKKINSETIKDQFDYEETAHPDLISKNRGAWDALRKRNSVGSMGDAGQAGQGGGMQVGRFKVVAH